MTPRPKQHHGSRPTSVLHPAIAMGSKPEDFNYLRQHLVLRGSGAWNKFLSLTVKGRFSRTCWAKSICFLGQGSDDEAPIGGYGVPSSGIGLNMLPDRHCSGIREWLD